MKHLESRKKNEIAHYDALAKEWQEKEGKIKWESDAEYLEHGIFSSYQFCDAWLKKYAKKKSELLDYGCGNGIHSILPAKLGMRVTGIDLSEESLIIARRLAKREEVANNTIFIPMDCEKLSFPDNFFDSIFDGGTFSSLDLTKAIPELARVLKPKRTLLAIETLGHNPLTNLKRVVNKWRGIRTGWAVDHIFKMRDIALLKNYFSNIEIHYFHLLSLIAFPFLSLPGGVTVLNILEKIDSVLLRISFLQRYAFKIVIICKNPKFKVPNHK